MRQPPLFDPEFDRPDKSEGRRSRGDSSWSLELGIAAMFTWIVPPLGLLIAAAGLASGWRAGLYRDRAKAPLGFVLSAIALALNMLICVGLFLVFFVMSGFRD